MSDPKFKPGDRVRVLRRSGRTSAEKGAVGTLLEADWDPWIRFDKPTGFGAATRSRHPDGWEPGYMDCLPEYDLELIP